MGGGVIGLLNTTGDSAMIKDLRSTEMTRASLLSMYALCKFLTQPSVKYLFYAQFTDEETTLNEVESVT